MADDCIPGPDGVIGAEAIRAAHVSKRSERYANNLAMRGRPLPHGRGSDQDPPPADPKELTFLAVDTRSPYTTDFEGADAGKTAHYMLRWVSTTGEKGPWSETASATVGA